MDAASPFTGSDPLESLKRCPDTGKLRQFRQRYMSWLYVLHTNPKFRASPRAAELDDSVKQELIEVGQYTIMTSAVSGYNPQGSQNPIH